MAVLVEWRVPTLIHPISSAFRASSRKSAVIAALPPPSVFLATELKPPLDIDLWYDAAFVNNLIFELSFRVYRCWSLQLRLRYERAFLCETSYNLRIRYINGNVPIYYRLYSTCLLVCMLALGEHNILQDLRTNRWLLIVKTDSRCSGISWAYFKMWSFPLIILKYSSSLNFPDCCFLIGPAVL